MNNNGFGVLTSIILSTILILAAITIDDVNAKAPATGGDALLTINAQNDKPGPVDIEVKGWDHKGNPTITLVLSWNADDNSFSDKSTLIPKETRVLRLTFVNDSFVPGSPDTDRNAIIDFFKINNVKYEAENFDRDGGPDPVFPGCGILAGGTGFIADCGNQGDFVEYDLHPGNPVGPISGTPGKGP